MQAFWMELGYHLKMIMNENGLLDRFKTISKNGTHIRNRAMEMNWNHWVAKKKNVKKVMLKANLNSEDELERLWGHLYNGRINMD